MGNTIAAGSTLPGGIQDLPSYLNELPGYVYQASLGGGKLLKTMQCLHDEGNLCVVKIFVKRDKDLKLDEYASQLNRVRDKFSLDMQPGVITLQKVDELKDESKAAFLVRQYFAHNLYDRFHTHPYLSDTEKYWFAFQLLTALTQMHGVGVRHGDLKCENILVTTWNWCFVTDIAFYKPTYLPADNPAEYTHFFDTSPRRRCYLAPERFLAGNSESKSTKVSKQEDLGLAGTDGQVTEAMDIFAAGCCIAEIFLEGEALFDLPQLLAYREGKYDPCKTINKITDPEIRALITQMISLDPSKRRTAKFHITNAIFPKYFGFLYKFFARLLSPELADPDIRIQALKHYQHIILREVVGEKRLEKDKRMYSKFPVNNEEEKTESSSNSRKPYLEELKAFTEKLETDTKELLDITHPLDISKFKIEPFPISRTVSRIIGRSSSSEDTVDRSVGPPLLQLPGTEVPSDDVKGVPKWVSQAGLGLGILSGIGQHTGVGVKETQDKLRKAAEGEGKSVPETPVTTVAPSQLQALGKGLANGLTMITNVICSCVQNVRYPLSKLTALELMDTFGFYVDDEIRLGRLVPYTVSMLTDPSCVVRCNAIKKLTGTLERVESFTPADQNIFTEYIFPSLSRFPTDSEELVRVAYAQSIAQLAETSRKFLDLSIFMQRLHKSEDTKTPQVAQQGSYDRDLTELQDNVLKLVIEMLTQGGSKVKRSLLADITRLCLFMGRERVNNELLPHLITVLNDKDWQLRAAFFEYIVGVSVFVGRVAFQNFILPCMEQALFDVEEFVIQRAVHALSALCELGLFEKRIMLEIVDKVTPLLCHPSTWIRNETINLMVAMAQSIGQAKSYCFLIPTLKPFLHSEIFKITREILMRALKKALTRTEFQETIRTFEPLETKREPSYKAEELRRGLTKLTSIGSLTSMSSIPTDNSDLSNQLPTSPSGGGSGEPEKKTSYLDDEELKVVMLQYIKRVAGALQAKTYIPTDTGSETGDDYDPERYITLEDEVQLYAVEVDKTVPDYEQVLVTQDKVSQDLYDALGIGLGMGPTIDPASKDQLARVQTVTVPIPGSDGKLKSKPVIRQGLDKVPDYVQKALKVPPRPPNLGDLSTETLSTSGFYQNHHRLEGGLEERDPKGWRPKGILIASLLDHKGPVNSLAVTRDNLFLASGSEDGTIKIWDVSRFKFSATPRAALTYLHGGKVNCITLCDCSHSVASASDNGTIHVFKVEYTESKEEESGSSTKRWIGYTDVKKVNTAKEGPALVIDHFNSLTESLLVYGTRHGVIHGWDLRQHDESFSLNIDPSMGLLTTMAVGPTPYSLLAGTSRGFILVWDMRFQIPIQTWRHNAKTAIVSLTPHDSPSVLPRTDGEFQHPTKGPLLFAAAQGTNEIAAFDLYTRECRVVFRTMATARSSGAIAIMGNLYTGGKTASPTLPTTRGKEIRHSFSAGPRQSISGSTQKSAKSGGSGPDRKAHHERGRSVKVSPFSLPSVRSYENYTATLDEQLVEELAAMRVDNNKRTHSIHSLLCCKEHFVITSGSDRVIRFWDLQEPTDSYRISSEDLGPHHLRCSGHLENNTVVFEEILSSADVTEKDQKKLKEYKAKMKDAFYKKMRGPVPPPTAHHDEILSMKPIEFPNKMLATSGRDGVVKIWV